MSAPGIRGRITGLSRLKRRLTVIEKAGKDATWKALVGTGALIQRDAVMSVQRGPKTGRVYGDHQASAPGEAPASDTGNLARNIRLKADKDKGVVEVIAKTPYAKHLEFGTAGDPSTGRMPMEPRPFMAPAFNRNRYKGAPLLKIAWKETLKPPEKG